MLYPPQRSIVCPGNRASLRQRTRQPRIDRGTCFGFVFEKLERLASLRELGLLTDSEFALVKEVTLNFAESGTMEAPCRVPPITNRVDAPTGGIHRDAYE